MFLLATLPEPPDLGLAERCQSTDLSARRTAQRLLYERYKRAMFSTEPQRLKLIAVAKS
ncbi:MAG TPA: hypothetical protein VK404_03045 [Spirosoma sp.]|nr:hypothetical protein [Spirosoma sp.]